MPESSLRRDLLERIKKRAEEAEAQGLGDTEVVLPERIRAVFSAQALKNNYEVLRGLAPGQSVLPMLKANGYGHGAVWAAKTLIDQKDLWGFGVATLEEGLELRKGIGLKHRAKRIVVFSGSLPWSEDKGRFCQKHGLTPVIASEEDWRKFLKSGWAGKIPYELKFNTGMNRLGIQASLAGEIARMLASKPAGCHPDGVFTHLAMGEKPDAKLSRAQRAAFEGVRAEFARATPGAHFHFANSSAIWNRKHWGFDDLTDIVRPGISLYGSPPYPGAPERGLLPVMTLEARVIAVHRLMPGQSLGYGATYSVPRPSSGPSSGVETKPVHVAVLSAGYADGLPRALSNRGWAKLNGRNERFLGRVSMDLCAVSCTAGQKRDDWAQLLGPEVDVWAQAEAADTIPYELYTSVSSRVKREYE